MRIYRLLMVPLPFIALFIYCWMESGKGEFETYFASNLLLFGLCIYCGLIVLNEYERKELVSPLALFASSTIGHFGASGLLYGPGTFFVSTSNTGFYLYSVLYVTAFTITYHISYRLIDHQRWIKARSSNANSGRQITSYGYWMPRRTYVFVAALLVIGLYARYVVVASNIYLQTSLSTFSGAQRVPFIGTIRQLEIFPDYALWILMILYFRLVSINAKNRELYRHLLYVIGIFFLVDLIYWIPTGKKFVIIQCIVLPAVIYYLAFRRLPSRKYMLISVLSIGLLFPLSHMYRVVQAKILGGQNVFSVSQTFDVVAEAIENFSSARQVGAGGFVLGRLNQLEPVAAAIRAVDQDQTQLHWGEDYLNVVVSLVPGFLWSGKPEVMYGNEFGHLSGMVPNSNLFTAISVTLPGESFLNFHVFGIFVATLLSAIYLLVYRSVRVTRCWETSTAIYVVSVPTILYLGASFALYISAMIQAVVIVLVGSYFVTRRVISSGSLENSLRGRITA